MGKRIILEEDEISLLKSILVNKEKEYEQNEKKYLGKNDTYLIHFQTLGCLSNKILNKLKGVK